MLVIAPVPASEATLLAQLSAEIGAGFDLGSELPWRVRLFALGENEHVLLIVMHHIVSDGWSTDILRRDLTQAYAARCQNHPPSWPALPAQYADYALWQHQALGDENDAESALALQLAYWRKTLAGIPEQLDIPCDRPRPAAATYRGSSCSFWLDENLHARVAQLAREAHVSVVHGHADGTRRLAHATRRQPRHPARQPHRRTHARPFLRT